MASNLRVLLRCLLFQPDLVNELPHDWAGSGVEAAAIFDLAEWLGNAQGVVSSAATIQNFQGTVHEALLAAEQAEIMQWGETFDVAAEFHGVLAKLREEQRKQQLQLLNAKMKDMDQGLKGLSEQEQALYLQLATERGSRK